MLRVKFDVASKGQFSCFIYYILKGSGFHLNIERQKEGKSNEVEGFVGVETLLTVWNIAKHRVDQIKGRTFFTTIF